MGVERGSNYNQSIRITSLVALLVLICREMSQVARVHAQHKGVWGKDGSRCPATHLGSRCLSALPGQGDASYSIIYSCIFILSGGGRPGHRVFLLCV